MRRICSIGVTVLALTAFVGCGGDTVKPPGDPPGDGGGLDTVSTFIRAWGSYGTYQKFSASDVSVDGSGNVYIADRPHGAIWKATWDGFFRERWRIDVLPRGITIDAGGNVYVSDADQHRIQKLDLAGRSLRMWGSRGVGEGQFDSPLRLSVRGSRVYVADTYNDRVQQFDLDGKFVRSWGSRGSAPGQFDLPQGIATDSDGNVYVADRNNHRIQKFDRDGRHLATFGTPGQEDGQLDEPIDVEVDELFNIYVAERGNRRIQKLDRDGTFVAKSETYLLPDGLALSASNVYVSHLGDPGRMTVLDKDLRAVSAYYGAWRFLRPDDKEFSTPVSLGIDPLGNVYVVDSGNYRVQKFDGAGNYLSKVASDPPERPSTGNVERPVDIAIDADGHVYVTNAGWGVLTYDYDFNPQGQWGWAPRVPGGASIAVDPRGNVYVVSNSSRREVMKFDNQRNWLTTWTAPAGAAYPGVRDIVADARGNIYISDSGNNRVYKLTDTGTLLLEWGLEGSGDGEFQGTSIGGLGIAIDRHDRVYVADSGNHRVQVFTHDGRFLTKFGEEGSGEGQFELPTAIVVDAGGNIYVADRNNRRIQKFRPLATP